MGELIDYNSLMDEGNFTLASDQSESYALPLGIILDQIEEALVVIESDKIVYLNKKFRDFLKLTKTSKKLFFSDIVPKNKYPELHDFIKNKKNLNKDYQNIYLLKTGQEIEVKKTILEYQKRQLLLVFCKIIDQHYIAGLLKYYSESAGNIYIKTDSSGIITNYNKHLINLVTISSNKIKKGFNIKNIISPEDIPIVEKLLSNKNKSKSPDIIEIELINTKGGIYFSEMVHKQEWNSDKQAIHSFMFIDNNNKKKFENKYLQNQKKLRMVLDLVPQMISLRDSQGKILLANKSFANFYKSTTKEVVYSHISDIHKNIEECNRMILQDLEVISGKKEKSWKDLEITDNENNKYFIKTTKVPFSDIENDQVYSLGISEDISIHKQKEIETREAKEKFRILVERGSDGILIIQDNQIVYSNRQAARMFGYHVEEFLNMTINDLLQRKQLKKTLEEFKINSQNKEPGNFYEIKIKKADGSIAYLNAKLNTINYQGKKSRLIFLREATKKKLAEINSERYKNMLEQAQIIANLGTWEYNFQQKSFECSAQVYKMLEEVNDSNSLKNLNWLVQYIPKEARINIYRKILEAYKTSSKTNIDFPIISGKGNQKTIHSQSQFFFTRSGKPERIIGTWLDITERIRLEQVLKESKRKAEESDNLKSAFLSNMSHEIRTPMNAILGFSHLLKSRDIDDATHLEYIEHIVQSGENLIKLINDIIDISKIESNQLEIEVSPCKLNDILDQLYNRFEEILAIENNCDISLKLEKAFPDADFTILLDNYRLQQVISYLMTNAIKFAPKGLITFGYSVKNSDIQFFVKDLGIGIPENRKDFIFKSFGKLEGTQRLNKSGTGLGLSISKSLVELMGGKIWFETKENVGTDFYFTIPLEFSKQKPSESIEIHPQADSESLKTGKKTILIAEDELLNYKLLESLLKKTGAEILWAKNGLEAVNIVSTNQIDLIFMDIKMPGMNGYEATKAIKKLNPKIPIIAQTAFAFSNERQYILQSGCDMYITKPINHQEVYNALNNYSIKLCQ